MLFDKDNALLGRKYPTYKDAEDALLNGLETANILSQTSSLTEDEGVRGLSGEHLRAYNFTLGNPEARKLILLSNGLHGVERDAGLLFIIWLLHNKENIEGLLGKDIKLVVADNLNPWGASAKTRVDQNGADPNRSFGVLPQEKGGLSPEYTRLDPDMNFNTLTLGQICVRLWGMWKQYRAPGGKELYMKIMAEGQSVDPTRAQYVPPQTPWTVKTTERIFMEALSGEIDLATHLDMHTALGPPHWQSDAEMLLIYGKQDSRFKQAHFLWGEKVVSTEDPDPISQSNRGTIEQLFEGLPPSAPSVVSGCFERTTLGTVGAIMAGWLRHNVLRNRDNGGMFFDLYNQLSLKAMGWGFYPPRISWRRRSVAIMYRILKRTVEGMRDGSKDLHSLSKK